MVPPWKLVPYANCVLCVGSGGTGFNKTLYFILSVQRYKYVYICSHKSEKRNSKNVIIK